MLKQGYYQEEGFGVKTLSNSVFDVGFQFPKLVNGTKNAIDASDFASSAAVKQQPALLAVGCAWKGHESGTWSDTPFSALNVGN